ncbi:MAG: calcium/sodium antiporter [Alphaproteobacteria bacterium]
MIVDFGLLLLGLVLLFFGGEALVRGSVSIAERFGISKFVVGLVIVGFGTSAPEMLVSVQAALAGSPDIAIGNIVGSNIANILLIVGVAALIAPIANNDTSIRRDIIVMVAVSAWLAVMLRRDELGFATGAALFAAFLFYLVVTYVLERRRQASVFVEEAKAVEERPRSPGLAAGLAGLGIVLLVAGAKVMVDGASGIAASFGISEAVIGLTVVAVGTSLPELATAIVAAIRRHGEVALANVIGSNIFNILAILGVTALIAPVPVAARFGAVDGPVMLGVAAGAAVLLFARKRLGRPVGAILLLAYAVYLYVQDDIGAGPNLSTAVAANLL